MNAMISLFIDNELSIEEKRLFIEKVRDDTPFFQPRARDETGGIDQRVYHLRRHPEYCQGFCGENQKNLN